MKRSIFMLLALGMAVIFAGCAKEETMAPGSGLEDQETAALKAAKTKVEFTGTCVPLPVAPLSDGKTIELPNGGTHVMGYVADWYDDATDDRVTGTSRWYANYFWEGVPFASPAKVFGKTEIYVGGDAEDNDGVWEMSWHGTISLTDGPEPFTAICYGNGVGKSGVVKGMTGKWTYTLSWTESGPCYITTGTIK
jgi:hypothetical protein